MSHKRILLLSDTHSTLPSAVDKYAKKADEIWHAGDIGSLDVISHLRKFAPVRAVYGNIDNQELRTEFDEDLWFDINGLKVYMTHIGGYPDKYNSRTRPLIRQRKPGLFVAGHSHILKVKWDSKQETLHMNPGAIGWHGFHKVMTMIRFEISTEGRVANPEVIELGPRRKMP